MTMTIETVVEDMEREHAWFQVDGDVWHVMKLDDTPSVRSMCQLERYKVGSPVVFRLLDLAEHRCPECSMLFTRAIVEGS